MVGYISDTFWRSCKYDHLLNISIFIFQQLDVAGGNSAKLSGGPLSDEYKVLQLHFHWGSDDTKGSEHVYDGMAFPMELHVVHWNSKYVVSPTDDSPDVDTILTSVDGLAVTGFMFEVVVRRKKSCNIIA